MITMNHHIERSSITYSTVSKETVEKNDMTVNSRNKF